MTSIINCHYEIPFLMKEFDFTCGAAALRMAIQALTEIDLTEKLVANLLGTSEVIGSPLKLFEENLNIVLKALNKETDLTLEWTVNQNGSFELLKEFLTKRYIVILNHKKISGGSHWAILRSISDNEIVLVDPEFGSKKTYLIEEFDWRGGIKTPTTKAYVAIRQKN